MNEGVPAVRVEALDVLVVDDEPALRLALKTSLQGAGHRVVVVNDGAEALASLARRSFDVVLSDVRLPQLGGLELFRHIRRDSPSTDVILMSAFGAIAEAVAALKEGAADYLSKPFQMEELFHALQIVSTRRTLQRQLAAARAELSGKAVPRRIVGRSPSMERLNDRIETFAQSDAAVLITGESGTGKELVAQTLHERSRRRDKPFVAVNCAAFPETLIEAELFGHERGAFTGAVKKRDGRFRSAQGGTIFLDEVAELSLGAQAKLLRVLQEGTFEPLGTNQPVHVDVRVISATNRNLKERLADRSLREDLFFRLKVLDIEIPPLRHRRSDLPVLVEHFLRMFAGAKPAGLTARAWAALAEYPFPGNVRELEHAIHHGAVLAKGGEIDLSHLPQDIAGPGVTGAADGSGAFRTMANAVADFEREYVIRAMRLAEGKKTLAAQLLGISRKTLWERLKLMAIHDEESGTGTAATDIGPERTDPGTDRHE